VYCWHCLSLFTTGKPRRSW